MRKHILLSISILAFATFKVFAVGIPQSEVNVTKSNKQSPDTLQTLYDNTTRKVLMPDGTYKILVEPSNQKPAAKGDTVNRGMILLGKPTTPNQKKADPNNPPELSRGLKKAKKGDFRGAIADFDSCILKNDKNHNAYFYKAKALIDLNSLDSALINLNLAIENDPNNSNYYFYRGRINYEKGENLTAFNDFDLAVILKPDFAEAINYRGVTRALTGNHAEAIIDYNSAIKLKPNYAIAYYNRGTAEAALGQFKEGVVSFTKCIELDPKKAMSYMNRGNCFVMLKEYESAIKDYAQVIEIEPKNSNAFINRGAALHYIGDLKYCDDWRTAQTMGNERATELLSEYCK